METPTQKPKTTPKDFFLNLGAIATLYVSVVSILNLLFEVINRAFPDPLQMYIDPYSSIIRWTIASLFIIFPLHILFSWILNRDIEKNPEKKELSVRKWLTFLTLFIASVIIAADLIVLINTFLGGEITTRFILKVLVVLAVIGSIFGYYMSDIHGKFTQEKGRRYFVWGSTLFILVSIVVGFMVMGSPQAQRMVRLDDQRVQALSSIQWQIVNYWQQKEKLPETLDQLHDPIGGFIVPTDPVSGEVYGYETTGKNVFKLCATFGASNQGGQVSYETSRPVPMPIPAKGYGNGLDENWQHGVGKTCFDRTIDPELYPSLKKK